MTAALDTLVEWIAALLEAGAASGTTGLAIAGMLGGGVMVERGRGALGAASGVLAIIAIAVGAASVGYTLGLGESALVLLALAAAIVIGMVLADPIAGERRATMRRLRRHRRELARTLPRARAHSFRARQPIRVVTLDEIERGLGQLAAEERARAGAARPLSAEDVIAIADETRKGGHRRR